MSILSVSTRCIADWWSGDFSRRFVCLTFDDGYRDTLQMGLSDAQEAEACRSPSMSPTSFPDRLGELWWLVLEAVIASNDRIGLVIDGRNRNFDCTTVAEKRALYDELYWWLRARPTEAELREVDPQPCRLLSRRHRRVLRRTYA